MNKKGQTILGIVIVIGLLIAVVYILTATRSEGISFSCELQKPTEITLTPSPGLNIAVPDPYCYFSMEGYVNNKKICGDIEKINPIVGKEGVIPCPEIENHRGEQLNIRYKYYDQNKEEKGSLQSEPFTIPKK